MSERQNAINTKETILNSLADMLEKMLTNTLNLSKQKKVEIIHVCRICKSLECLSGSDQSSVLSVHYENESC